MEHEEITEEIIGAAFELINELGSGFVESVYQNALEILLRERGLGVRREVPLSVSSRGHDVGRFAADMVINEKVIVELKAVKALLPEHQAQVINYLKATGMKVGLLINFGRPRLEYKRLQIR